MGHTRLVLGQLASDMCLTVPLQERAYKAGQMIPDKEGEQAAEWSNDAEVRAVLQQLLDRPFDDVLGVASIFPCAFGGLMDRHVVQLDAMANNLKAYFDVSSANYSYTMHVWLFHLLGGRQASLTAPSSDLRDGITRSIGSMCSRFVESYNSRAAGECPEDPLACGMSNGHLMCTCMFTLHRP